MDDQFLNLGLKQLNHDLKLLRYKVTIQGRSKYFELRATLPIKENIFERKQQRLRLKILATYENIAEARKVAIELGEQIQKGTFSWSNWVDGDLDTDEKNKDIVTVDEFKEAARRLHQQKSLRNPAKSENTYQTKWVAALKKLPSSGVITPGLLVAIVKEMPWGSASRRDKLSVLAMVAKSLGWDTKELIEVGHGYGTERLKAKAIPSDEEIVEIYNKLPLAHWKWSWGMLATFGLRPHELAEVELKIVKAGGKNTFVAAVAEETKTGSRETHPCRSEWFDLFHLKQIHRPEQAALEISRALGNALERIQVRFTPYSCRHAYAIRLLSRGLPPELGARMMGHSLAVHTLTYQRWITQAVVNEAVGRYQL